MKAIGQSFVHVAYMFDVLRYGIGVRAETVLNVLKSLRKRCVVCALGFTVASAVFMPAVAETGWHFAVEPLFGIKYGQLDEYVFLEKSNYNDDTLSELVWDIKPEIYGGVQVRGGWKGIFGELRVTGGIPMQTGAMADYDWLNNDPNDVADSSKCGNWLTCYSEHDNRLEEDFSFGIKGGYEFTPSRFFSIMPALAFDYNSIRFSAKDGEGWYGYGAGSNFRQEHGYYAAYNDAENQYRVSFIGQVITYRRESYYVWLGGDFTCMLPCRFVISAGAYVAPYVYAISYDSHLVTKRDYADITDGFFAAVKGNFGVTYRLDKHFSFLLAAEYLYLRPLRGDDYYKIASESAYRKADAVQGGAGASCFSVSHSVRFTIF